MSSWASSGLAVTAMATAQKTKNLDGLQRTSEAAATVRLSCIEGATVVGIGGGEGRHLDRLTIGRVLEQHIQIPILALAKDKVRRPVPHERQR
jgi:hypothetical protein